ncbi:MAG TPA: isocitrate lyase/phosphoenolpyruvate mutase family protein [Mycobacteriales bacterium]
MTSNSTATLRALHHGPHPVVLPNVWDAASARVFTDAGFPALATSSSAVAAALGYDDGERTPAAEMFAAIRRIARSVEVPVTADVESGYGLGARELVDRLAETGVAGCNLEDSDPATRTMKNVERQAEFLAAVRDHAGDALVLNARVDVFLHTPFDPRTTVATAIARARRYLTAGADCVYPILAPADTLPELVAGIDGPVNVLHLPGGPSVGELSALGVARITFGGSLHKAAIASLRDTATALHHTSLSTGRGGLPEGQVR